MNKLSYKVISKNKLMKKIKLKNLLIIVVFCSNKYKSILDSYTCGKKASTTL